MKTRIALTAALLLFGTLAQAANTCQSIDGQTVAGDVGVVLNVGESLLLSTPDAATLAISIEFNTQGGTDNSICSPTTSSCDGHSHTARRNGRYVIDEFSAGAVSYTVTCGAGIAPTPTGGTTTGTATAQSLGATVAAAGSGTAIGAAIRNVANGSGPTVSTQGLFLTTGGSAGAGHGWAAFTGRALDGDVDGRTSEFTIGTDFQVSWGTRIGMFLSKGKANFNVNGTAVDTDALSFGPYFQSRISDRYSVTGYAFFARPDYTVGTTIYEAERRGGGLDVSANYIWGATQVESFLGLSGFAEDHPAAGALAAREISMLTGSIGTRATFATGSALQPYLSIGADFSRYDNGLNGRQTHNTPRVGTGFTYSTGSSTLAMDLNGGNIIQDTRDVKLRLKYAFNF